jgi:hypothetical protein
MNVYIECYICVKHVTCYLQVGLLAILQMLPRGGNRNYRFTPNARNTPDASVPPQGIMGAMLPPLDIGGVPVPNADTGVPQPLPTSALASALASAPPEQQRAVCFSTFFAILHWKLFALLYPL